MGGAKKKIKKIIPKEIAPAAPFIASALVGPAFAGSNFLSSRIANEAVRNAVAKGIVSAATETAQGGKGKDILRAGVLAAAPDAISAGVNKAAAGTGDFAKFLNKSKTLKDGTQTMTLAERAAAIANPETLGGKVKLAGAQTALNVAPKIAEMNEKALRDYEAQLREQGIADSAQRRNAIFGYFSRAGYGDDEINSMLNKYGYADGGRVGFSEGGIFAAMRAAKGRGKPMTASAKRNIGKISDVNPDAFEKIEDVEEEELSPFIDYEKLTDAINKDEFDSSEFLSGLQAAQEGLTTAFGRPLNMKPSPTRFGLADGGIPSSMKARKTIAELIQAGVLDEEDVEKAVNEIKMQAMNSMRAPGFAEGGIMNVSDLNNDRFLEQRAEEYMEEGFSPDEAMDKALDDLKNNRFPALKDGGMMNFGGREMDMRGGGFIPIGKKERADDVPARLSKNEFVMTADAVRGAGNGSINKGAKRMYDLMNKLESKV